MSSMERYGSLGNEGGSGSSRSSITEKAKKGKEEGYYIHKIGQAEYDYKKRNPGKIWNYDNWVDKQVYDLSKKNDALDKEFEKQDKKYQSNVMKSEK